jgi:predicted ribosomally synthesized peptide with SipW-like signal peptide
MSDPARRPRGRWIVILVCLGVLAGGGGVTYAAFSATTVSSANSFSAAPDWVAPTVSRSTAAQAGGGVAQHIHPGASYHLYGELSDSGNPASGVASVTANLSALSSGQTAAAMPSGAFSFGGIGYSHRSAALTANATLAACSYTPTITSTDGAGNARTEDASKVMVDRDLLSAYHIRIDGFAAADEAGLSVANAGDVNADGRPDVLVGAHLANHNLRTDSGSAYVVFGQATTTTIDLAALGVQGYRIDGAAADDRAGYSVANAGDLNGDGRSDALVGAPGADNNGRSFSGSAYVVFGKTTPPAIDLAALGSQGYRIDGVAADDQTGIRVGSAGDVNGDGRSDAFVVANNADNNARVDSGSVYVVFGKTTTTAIDLAALGSQGYRIDSAGAGDQGGDAVANAGDLNGDGRPDALVGAPLADNNFRADSGSAYVVFGKATTTAIDLAALGSQGYRIDGAAATDYAGYAAANAGDVNGDGLPDALVGAFQSDNNSRTDSGSAYVVFGKTTTTTIDLAALGSQGYRIDGAGAVDITGYAVASAGDVNGDGVPDALVGAPYADYNGRTNAGASYVVFGKTTTTAIDLASLGGQGYRIDGAGAGDQSGGALAGAGDVNGDGRPDLLVGATTADNNGRTDSGSAYTFLSPACS